MLAILRRLQLVGPLLARHFTAYLELAADDTAQLTRALLRRLLAGIAALLGATLTLLIASIWIIAASWDSPRRGLIFIGLLVLFGGLTAGAALLARRPWSIGEEPFARLGCELRSDRRLIDELLGADEGRRPESAAPEPDYRMPG